MGFHPYLTFDGNCREAMTRYQEIFGGELVIMPFSELPDGAESPPGTDPDQVMHAALMWEGNLLMASDDPTGGSGTFAGVSVSHSTTDVEVARAAFDGLMEGGEVQMPFGEVFWSPGFGTGVDRFGVPWMVSTDGPEAG